MPTSDKQLAANRRNALRSTGPQTPAGKAASSRNGFRRGLLSRNLLLPDESRDAFSEFQRALLIELDPIGPIQSILAERIIASAWRLRRALGIETAVFTRLAICAEPDSPPRYLGASLAFLHEGGGGAAVLERLSRYETHLNRCFHRDLRKLRALQENRPSSPAAAPPKWVRSPLRPIPLTTPRSPSGSF